METTTKESIADPKITISIDAVHRAWTALGYMAFCGTARGKIGVMQRDYDGLTPYAKGEVVIVSRERSPKTVTIEKPCRAETLGDHGFLATVGTVINVPEFYVKELDCRKWRDLLAENTTPCESARPEKP